MTSHSRHGCKMVLAIAALLAGVPDPAPAQTLPPDHPKVKWATKIYDDLDRAVGSGRVPPSLVVYAAGAKIRMRIAWYNPARNMIGMEERLIDLCKSFGRDAENALAHVLAHEFAHFFRNHGWTREFGNAFADLEVGEKMKDLAHGQKLIGIETEADHFGGFYGHVAGYDTLGVAEKVLDSIYQQYGLRENLRGYPGLEERKKIAARSRQRLSQLIPVFETGVKMLMIQRYREAARCFDHVGSVFPSPEILNNAGVARALEALGLFDRLKLRFSYPFEFDASTRLPRSHRASLGFGESKTARRARLLSEALALFETARGKNPRYATAIVNIAACWDLKGERELGAAFAGLAGRIAAGEGQKMTAATAMVVRAIALANLGRTKEAIGLLHKASADHPALAADNLTALGVKADSPVAAGKEKVSLRREKIAGLGIDMVPAAFEKPRRIVLKYVDADRPRLEILVEEGDGWSGVAVVTPGGQVSILSTKPGFRGKSARHIRIGSPLAAVKRRHGAPSRLVGSRQGTYHVYGKKKIIFAVGADGKVTGWSLYEVK